jgi:hypothetical protein
VIGIMYYSSNKHGKHFQVGKEFGILILFVQVMDAMQHIRRMQRVVDYNLFHRRDHV